MIAPAIPQEMKLSPAQAGGLIMFALPPEQRRKTPIFPVPTTVPLARRGMLVLADLPGAGPEGAKTWHTTEKGREALGRREAALAVKGFAVGGGRRL
jgi:hypothetical protein